MPSRADIFNNTPSEALPAPPDLRIAFFISSVKHKLYRVEDDGIVVDEAYYESVRQDEDARECMSKAAAIYKSYKIKVPIIQAILNGRETLFVKFADRDFEPIRKRKARSFRGKTHPEQQKADIQRISSRLPGLLERMDEIILEKFGAELGQDAYFKTSVPLHSTQRTGPEPAPPQDKADTSGAPEPSDQRGQANGDSPRPTVKSLRKKPTSIEAVKPEDTPNDETPPEPPTISNAVRQLRESFYKNDEEAL